MLHSYFVMLLVAVLFATTSDPASASRKLQPTTSGAPLRALENDIPAKRLLRAYEAEDEDRGISAKIPGIEKLANAFKPTKTKELQALLKTDESIIDAFKTLKLNSMSLGKNGVVDSKKAAEFFSSPNFKIWSSYATKMDKQDPQGAMLATLTLLFGDKNLATMILLGKDTRSSRSAAKKLETAQFNLWFNRGERPDGVLVNMLGVKLIDIHGFPREKSIWINFSNYVTNRVKYY